MPFVRSRGIRIALALAGLLTLLGAAAALASYVAFWRDLPDLREIRDYRPPLASRVLDRKGRVIGRFFVERRRLTPLESVPRHVVHAFVAGEDSAFYDHAGIDYASIVRAAWVNLRAGGEIKQGGSTITQQMVKGLLLSPERSYRRKIREMILARDIEQRFTKDEILYLYLNQIYFGHGAYGVGEAAFIYFGKDVGALSVSEGALLAGLPKAPSRYSPYASPEQAESRRRYVLDRMLEEHFIDASTHAAAVEEVPALADADGPDHEDVAAAASFAEEVRRHLFDALGGDTVLRGGLSIETTLDLDLQRSAVEALRHGLVDLDRRQGYRRPPRRVAPSEIAAELARVAGENEIAAPGEGAEPIPPRARLPARRPLLGVVTAVDAERQIARVGLAPDLEGVVRLADVAWAREPDPARLPWRVRSIDRVFEKGDVAPFDPLPPAEAFGGDPVADEPLFLGLHQDPIVQGALLSLEVESGDVLALVGGYDFAKSQFNRVTQARRQPGSAFKPLIYGAAVAQNYTLSSILFDRPVVYSDEASGFTWRPQNYGRSFYGPITLRQALARSVNNATVHLFRDLGVDYVIDYARRLGITSPLNRDLSLALGSSDVSLLEITRAYAVFPAAGRRVVPRFIRRVTDADGAVLLEDVPLGDALAPEEQPPAPDASAEIAVVDPDQLIPVEQAYLMTDLLRAVVTDPQGTGGRLRAIHRPVAGKTGTTNEQGDAWFVGFSPDIATGVWVGHDESRFLGSGETGARAAAPIWVDYMRAALEDRPARDFFVPEPIVFARVDRQTGLLADVGNNDSVFVAFLSGTEPTETDTSARASSETRRQLRLDSF